MEYTDNRETEVFLSLFLQSEINHNQKQLRIIIAFEVHVHPRDRQQPGGVMKLSLRQVLEDTLELKTQALYNGAAF